MAAESLDAYFKRVNPVYPPGDPRFIGPPAPDLQVAVTRLTRQMFGVLPNQLDRARDYRNRFIRAVQ